MRKLQAVGPFTLGLHILGGTGPVIY